MCTSLHQVNGSETNRMHTRTVQCNNMLFYTENESSRKKLSRSTNEKVVC